MSQSIKTTDVKLPVRVRVWHRPGEPAVEYLSPAGKWVACHSLKAARSYALGHGYAGIKVKPL